MHVAMNNYFEAKCGEAKLWDEKLVFENFLCVESILSQVFTHVEFSCVFLTNPIFMSIMFHPESRDPEHDPVTNPRMEFPQQKN